MLASAFRRIVLARPWLCFVVMCAGFAVFGVGTLNLFLMLQANLSTIAEHGWLVLMQGAAQQLLELLVTLGISMVGYLVFKTCEHQLVARWSANHEPDSHP
jgi:hypothetical protein